MADTTPAEDKPNPEVAAKSEPEPAVTSATKPSTDSAAETASATALTSTVDAPSPVAAPAAAPAASVTESAAPVAAAEPAAPPRERELVQDARLGVLRGMFPDFDDSLLQSVLDSVQGNTDRAIDALLGMSDPDFQSEQPPPAQAAPQSQEELDEQLARTLMLEDERSEHVWRAQQQQQPPPQRPEPRRQGSSAGSQDKDAMQEFQEQFNKFAESGKKTLGSLFSKVKAKIQEFDQPQGASSQNAGVGGDTYPYDAGAAPYPSRHEQIDRVRREQASREQAQMPAYYDPNGGEEGGSPTRVGYDAAPGPVTGTPPPATTNAGAPQIDGGKLGMLPKRPVSLLRTSSPPITLGPHPTTGGAPPSSDDDDLEYAENPFEEGGKK